MRSSSDISRVNRRIYKSFLDEFRYPDSDRYKHAVDTYFVSDADINVVHPFNAMSGSEQYYDVVLGSLLKSFEGLYRRDYILMAGQFEGAEWVSSTGYYAGKFVQDWLGIRASNALAYLRVGEFHKMVDGKIVASHIFFDIPELMLAVGQWPTECLGGYCGFLPGPASQDGLLLETADSSATDMSLKMVEDMLMKLNTPDEAWRPYWHPNMLWYGPSAFGSYVGIEEFRSFQVPFESTFEGWSGGMSTTSPTRHFTRYGDGNYVCSGGWPSLSGVHVKRFLGQEPTQETVYMRVCDWWRRDGDLLVENWVFVDVPDLLRQLGNDIFADQGKHLNDA